MGCGFCYIGYFHSLLFYRISHQQMADQHQKRRHFYITPAGDNHRGNRSDPGSCSAHLPNSHHRHSYSVIAVVGLFLLWKYEVETIWLILAGVIISLAKFYLFEAKVL